MKPVAQLDEDFPGIAEVKSAKGQAVVQHYAAVAHIQCRNRSRKTFSKFLAEGKIDRCVPGQIVHGGTAIGYSGRCRTIAIEEPRPVIHIARYEASPRKGNLSSNVQSVSLVMIQRAIAIRIVIRRGNQPARDIASGFANLIGVGQVDLCSSPQPRRSQRYFPAADQCLGQRNRNEDIRIAYAIVIEKIIRPSVECVCVEIPAFERHRHAVLILFIPFAKQGPKAVALTARCVYQRGP